MRSFEGHNKFVRGPHLARGPQFADPWATASMHCGKEKTLERVEREEGKMLVVKFLLQEQ